MLRKSCFFEDLTNSTSSTFSLTLLFFFNPKQAGGSESMYKVMGYFGFFFHRPDFFSAPYPTL